MSHRFIPVPTSPAARKINPEHTLAIQRWTAEVLRPRVASTKTMVTQTLATPPATQTKE